MPTSFLFTPSVHTACAHLRQPDGPRLLHAFEHAAQVARQRPAERLAMGQRARLRVAERHSADVLASRLEALYRSVLEGAQGTRDVQVAREAQDATEAPSRP